MGQRPTAELYIVGLNLNISFGGTKLVNYTLQTKEKCKRNVKPKVSFCTQSKTPMRIELNCKCKPNTLEWGSW